MLILKPHFKVLKADRTSQFAAFQAYGLAPTTSKSVAITAPANNPELGLILLLLSTEFSRIRSLLATRTI
jgi:hypothetical protein